MRPPNERAARRGVDRRRPDRLDRRRWILAVSVGEGIGFAITTSLAVLGLDTGIDGTTHRVGRRAGREPGD